MAVIVKSKRGKVVYLLNPSEKGNKYASELRSNCAKTNTLYPKKDKFGLNKELTKEQRAYRAGYLSAQRDSADVYCAKVGQVPARKLKKMNEEQFYGRTK